MTEKQLEINYNNIAFSSAGFRFLDMEKPLILRMPTVIYIGTHDGKIFHTGYTGNIMSTDIKKFFNYIQSS